MSKLDYVDKIKKDGYSHDDIEIIDDLFTEVKNEYLRSTLDREIFNRQQKNINIPVSLFDNNFINDLFTYYDIFEIRNIINKSAYVTNSVYLDEKVKEIENYFIENAKEGILLPEYKKIYERYLENESALYDEIEIEKILGKTSATKRIIFFDRFQEVHNKEEFYQLLVILSSEEISNYIIDYHFDEIFYNVLTDMGELLSFYDRGHIELEKTHLEIYRKIMSIDSLSISEKIKLHHELFKYDIKSMFYDDMLKARRIVNKSIKDCSLNSESIKKYRNEELSNQYGVDVYEIEDKDLCAIVRSGGRSYNGSPGGRSYSLVGDKCLDTFGTYNHVYDANYLNIDQIMHISPSDSYTHIVSYGGDDSVSNRINRLLLPNELLDESKRYNEILIKEKGSNGTPDDEFIPELPILAVYTDNITEYDVEAAKKNGVGILLVRKNLKQDSYKVSNDTCDGYYQSVLDIKFEEGRKRK